MRILSKAMLICFSLTLGMVTGCHSAGSNPASSAANMTKIDPELAVVAADLAHGTPVAARTDPQGRLLVYAYVTDTSAATLEKVAGAGLQDGQPSPAMGVIQGWIAPKDLAALAGLTCVKRIALPRYASPR